MATSVPVLQVSARKETAFSVMVTGFRQQKVASSWSESLPESAEQQVHQEFKPKNPAVTSSQPDDAANKIQRLQENWLMT